MKNGAWTMEDFDTFDAIRAYDTHLILDERMGMDTSCMPSLREYVDLLIESKAEVAKIRNNMNEKMEEIIKKKMKEKENKDVVMNNKNKEIMKELPPAIVDVATPSSDPAVKEKQLPLFAKEVEEASKKKRKGGVDSDDEAEEAGMAQRAVKLRR